MWLWAEWLKFIDQSWGARKLLDGFRLFDLHLSMMCSRVYQNKQKQTMPHARTCYFDNRVDGWRNGASNVYDICHNLIINFMFVIINLSFFYPPEADACCQHLSANIACWFFLFQCGWDAQTEKMQKLGHQKVSFSPEPLLHKVFQTVAFLSCWYGAGPAAKDGLKIIKAVSPLTMDLGENAMNSSDFCWVSESLCIWKFCTHGRCWSWTMHSWHASALVEGGIKAFGLSWF